MGEKLQQAYEELVLTDKNTVKENYNNPKVSIIVPVYNCEKYLKRCLDSLVMQTLENIEIICINDGSTDKSLDILKEYESNIVIINQENQGQSIARNKGLEVAKGEYIGFVDSDDWVDTDYFEKLYKTAKKHDTDIAATGIVRLNNFNKKFHIKFSEEIITDDVNKKFQLCDVPDKSYVWNKIYKRKELLNNKLKFVENLIYEDCIFTPQALHKLNKLVTVPDTYYYYWRRANSTVTLRNKKSNKDKIYAHGWAENYMKEHNIQVHKSNTKRYKIFGLSIYKITTKNGKIEHRLFNIIKW